MSCDCSGNDDIQLDPSGYVTPSDAWNTCIVNMVRAHIGDYSDPPEYTDERILQIAAAAAYFVSVDIASCDVTAPSVACDGTMSFDPMSYPSFVNLVVLKAACMLDRGMMRSRFQTEGIAATCGPAALRITAGSGAYDAFAKFGACAAYAELKKELCFMAPLRSARCAIQIVSFFVSDHYHPGCCNPCRGPRHV